MSTFYQTLIIHHTDIIHPPNVSLTYRAEDLHVPNNIYYTLIASVVHLQDNVIYDVVASPQPPAIDTSDNSTFHLTLSYGIVYGVVVMATSTLCSNTKANTVLHWISVDHGELYTINPENYAEIIFAFYFYTESNFHISGRLYN